MTTGRIFDRNGSDAQSSVSHQCIGSIAKYTEPIGRVVLGGAAAQRRKLGEDGRRRCSLQILMIRKSRRTSRKFGLRDIGNGEKQSRLVSKRSFGEIIRSDRETARRFLVGYHAFVELLGVHLWVYDVSFCRSIRIQARAMLSTAVDNYERTCYLLLTCTSSHADFAREPQARSIFSMEQSELPMKCNSTTP